MALLGGAKGFTIGFLTGFGAGILARDYLPEAREALAPVLKMAMRSGLVAMEKTRELAARFGESLQDNWAEAQEELKSRSVAAKRRPVATKRKRTGGKGAEVVTLRPEVQ